MKEKKLTFVNTLFWVFGAIYAGELLLQAMVRLGLEIETYEYYLKLQFLIFLPIGVLAYFAMRTTLAKYISSLATTLSILMINFVLILTYSFDDPWAYVKENQEDTIQAFTGNTILLLPLLIGFVATQLVVILLPKLMKGKTAKEMVQSMYASIKNKTEKKATPKKKTSQSTAKKKAVKKTKKSTQKKTGKSTRTKKSTANAAKKTSKRSKKSK